jgi:hypothetical protein
VLVIQWRTSKDQHLTFSIRQIEFERRGQGIGRLLIIIEHEVPADGGHLVGKSDVQAPARHVHLTHSLVADVAATIHHSDCRREAHLRTAEITIT